MPSPLHFGGAGEARCYTKTKFLKGGEISDMKNLKYVVVEFYVERSYFKIP